MPGAWLPYACAAAGLMAAIVAPSRSVWRSAGLVMAFAGAGALLWNARHQGPIGDDLSRIVQTQSEDLEYALEGAVERPDILLPQGGYLQFILRADSAVFEGQRRKIEGGVLVRWTNPGEPLYVGDRVRVVGKLDLALGRINPGVNSPEDYYRGRDVHTELRIFGPKALERTQLGSAFSPRYLASRFRNDIARRLVQAVPESSLPFVLTVWLGDRRRITDETYDAFLQSGTAHILAVSGVHISIIFVSLAYFLKLLIRDRRARILTILSIVFLFAFMAGARVSSLRAALMILLYLTADWFDREPDTPTALSLAAILFTLHDPDVLFETGFQLSFFSVASILAFRRPIADRLQRLPRLFSEALSATLAVQILSVPIAIAAFHVFPIVSVAVNLLVIPLLTLVLWLAFLTSAAAVIAPPIAPLFGHALHPIVWTIESIATKTAALPGGHVFLSSPTTLALAAYFAGVVCLLVSLRSAQRTRPLRIAAVVALAAAVIFWKPFSQPAEVTFLDVGHGDAAFVRTPGGATALIDTGDRTGFMDHGKRTIARYLWADHTGRIDALFITHPDRDHIGGAPYLLQHFSVGTVYMGPPTGELLEARVVAICKERHIPIRRLARGERIHLAGAQFEVLHPPENWMSQVSVNERSLVMRLSWPGLSVLFTGDIEDLAEGELSTNDIHAAILKVPHHGSNTSSSLRLLDAVEPDLAVISVGRRRGGSVLRDSVLRRYAGREITTLRTDRAGGIRIRQKSGILDIQTARGLQGYPIRESSP